MSWALPSHHSPSLKKNSWTYTENDITIFQKNVNTLYGNGFIYRMFTSSKYTKDFQILVHYNKINIFIAIQCIVHLNSKLVKSFRLQCIWIQLNDTNSFHSTLTPKGRHEWNMWKLCDLDKKYNDLLYHNFWTLMNVWQKNTQSK